MEPRRPRGRRLTARQESVLDLVTAGHSNKEIAHRLGVSEQRVKEHVSALLRALGVPNRAALAGAAARRGFVGTFEVDPDWLRFLFRDAPVAIAVLTGPEHRFIALNEAYRSTLEEPEIVGLTYREAFPERRESLEILDEAYRSGRTVARSDLPRRFIRVPGATPEDGFLSVWVQPLPGTQGNTAGLVIFSIDSTECVRAPRRVDGLAGRPSAEDPRSRRERGG